MVSGAVNTSAELNADIAKTISATAVGVAEGAIEASAMASLALIPQITAAAVGASEDAVHSANEASLDVAEILKALSSGLTQGAFKAIPGQGGNIRIFIEPIENPDLLGIQKAIESGIFEGAKRAGYLPIIHTPFEDDPTVRQVSPFT